MNTPMPPPTDTPKKTLLVIAHTPSPNTQQMAEAVIRGASSPETAETVQVVFRRPLETRPEDLLSAQAVILGTTENLGYMAGLMKDVFDRCYYAWLDKTQGLPFAFYIRAGHDGTGTRRAIETITTGLRWRQVREPLICRGDFDPVFLAQCQELGLTLAVSLDLGVV